MTRLMLLIALTTVLLSSVGCSTMHPPQQKPFAGFPYRHNGFDFKKAWKASPTPTGLEVQGVLKNVRYQRVENLELTVSLLKNGENIVAEESTNLLGALSRDDYRDFSIVLNNVTASPGDLLQFQIRYTSLDGSNNSLKWSSDFRADAITGRPVLKQEEMPADE